MAWLNDSFISFERGYAKICLLYFKILTGMLQGPSDLLLSKPDISLMVSVSSVGFKYIDCDTFKCFKYWLKCLDDFGILAAILGPMLVKKLLKTSTMSLMSVKSLPL